MADTKDIRDRLAEEPKERERVSVFINKRILDDFKAVCKKVHVGYNDALEEFMRDATETWPKKRR